MGSIVTIVFKIPVRMILGHGLVAIFLVAKCSSQEEDLYVNANYGDENQDLDRMEGEIKARMNGELSMMTSQLRKNMNNQIDNVISSYRSVSNH